jgi:hypothetical protein
MTEKSEPIRVQRALLREVRKLAAEAGTSVTEFVNVAVAEKVGALRTARFFAERGSRADVPGAIELLRRLGPANRRCPATSSTHRKPRAILSTRRRTIAMAESAQAGEASASSGAGKVRPS